ncbi:MAG: replication-associated recombination protein A, partial [Peptococcus niger]
GMPEGRIILSQACVYLCEAPKSNAAYLAIDAALSDVRQGRTGPVPLHLKDSHYKGAKQMGYGQGYLYPHDYPHHRVAQAYLPEAVRDAVYYTPDDTVPKRKDKPS